MNKPEPGKPLLLISSILKPADDARAYYRLAKRLSGSYEVSVSGRGQSCSEKRQVGLGDFERLSLGRFKAQIKTFRLALHFPNFIVCCPELLPWALLWKFFRRISGKQARLVYDLQEDYYRNIRFQQNFPKVIRRVLAESVRQFEKLSSHFYEKIILAEKCYATDISFLQKREAVLFENKFSASKSLAAPYLHEFSQYKEYALLCGTFSQTYGTIKGIHFFEELQKQGLRLKLLLAGFAPDPEFRQKLTVLCLKNPNIICTEIDRPLAYARILAAQAKAEFIMMPYKSEKSTAGRIPSKFYEALALGKPVIIPPRPEWASLLKPHLSFLTTDFSADDAKRITKAISEAGFTDRQVPQEVWALGSMVL